MYLQVHTHKFIHGDTVGSRYTVFSPFLLKLDEKNDIEHPWRESRPNLRTIPFPPSNQQPRRHWTIDLVLPSFRKCQRSSDAVGRHHAAPARHAPAKTAVRTPHTPSPFPAQPPRRATPVLGSGRANTHSRLRSHVSLMNPLPTRRLFSCRSMHQLHGQAQVWWHGHPQAVVHPPPLPAPQGRRRRSETTSRPERRRRRWHAVPRGVRRLAADVVRQVQPRARPTHAPRPPIPRRARRRLLGRRRRADGRPGVEASHERLRGWWLRCCSLGGGIGSLMFTTLQRGARERPAPLHPRPSPPVPTDAISKWRLISKWRVISK